MPLTLISVTPPTGPAGVATPVTVECTDLNEPIHEVKFRGVDATEVVFVSSVAFTCKVPPLTAGPADLSVIDKDASAFLDPAYEYLAVVDQGFAEIQSVSLHAAAHPDASPAPTDAGTASPAPEDAS